MTSGRRPPWPSSRDELVGVADLQTIPAAEPVAGAADDGDDAAGVGGCRGRWRTRREGRRSESSV